MKSDRMLFTLLAATLSFGATTAWAGLQQTQAKAPAKEQKAAVKSEAKTHEASGTISSFTETKLVLTHKVSGKDEQMNFVLDPSTQRKGTLAAGAHAVVNYRVENKENIATKVEVQEMKGAAKPAPAKPKP